MPHFEKLDTQEGLAHLNKFLENFSYAEGYTPSQTDAVTFAHVPASVDAKKHAHVARWRKHIASFSEEERKAWPAAPAHSEHSHGHDAGGHQHGAHKGQAHDEKPSGSASAAEPAGGAKKEKKDDDFDLFDDEEDAEHEALLEKRRQEHEAKKVASGKVVVGKSSVILEVKPWDDETDLAAMEAAVRAIQLDGLTWGAGKLVPIAYGLRKLQIICTVIDDVCSVDELTEKIQDLQDLVQSVDIAAFNKL